MNANLAADYGLPTEIQQGNILHCFNWTANEIKAELPNIAAAGFGSVQLSPLQRPDIRTGSSWHDLYRPYDLAFKSSSFCSENDLKNLCTEAAKYGIKVIVDVVANHVDKTSGYHDTWWDSNGRVRWNGSINYGDRYSITHGQLGDYGDINSEASEVCSRGKAYVEKLKSLGVKGIRWDAAKHIGLPSENCNFWSSVTSVPGMWHYGEILDNPGPNPSIIKEYTNYMSVTDNRYCNYAARENGGIPGGYGGDWVVNQGCPDTKMVYWAESHDTYGNDEWSQNVDQSVIDRAYAAYASRNGATALYLARPNVKGFGNIKIGKGSTAFKNKQVAEVNKFRNAMVGRKDWFESANNACCITREGGGAVIVMKGSGNISIKNGGGYCPAGTYTDRIGGGTFTVTATTITGNVGSTGIAVLYNGNVTPPGPNPDPNPDPDPIPDGDMWILGNLKTGGWSTTPGTGAAMTKDGTKYKASGVEFAAASGESKCFFNLTDYVGATWDDLNMNANRYGAATEGEAISLGTAASVVKYANNVDASGCLSWTIAPGKYDVVFDMSAMKLTVTNVGVNPNPDPNPNPNPDTQLPAINGVYLKNTASWSQPYVWAWGDENSTASGNWPGDMMVKYNDEYWKWELPAGKATPKNIIFNPGSDNGKTGDLVYVNNAIYDCSGKQIGMANGNVTPPNPGDQITIYYDNSLTKWNNVNIHYWDSPKTEWPGTSMTKVDSNIWKYTFPSSPSTLKGFLFCDGSGSGDDKQTGDYTSVPLANHLYKGAGGSKGAVSDEGEYGQPVKPVVTANPASGTTFSDGELTVTLSVSPAATIYYTLNGSAATASSTKYTKPITIRETTTISTLAVAADGSTNSQQFKYTKGEPVVVNPGNNLITNYYKVNPNGQVGTNKTINVSGHPATNAFTNWTDKEIIAQGVARDVAQAFKGHHERPIVDSYTLYGAWDNDYLYLGVQFVYTIWDLYGEGKQPGESKPYNMDGHMFWAFDLHPDKKFDGYINGNGPIWNDDAKGAKFDNGVDAVLMCSTKPGVGNPGLFLSTPDGHASYDAAYCKDLPNGFYGYKDGLHPGITHVWGQSSLDAEASALLGNEGFTDLRSEIDDDAHTFYEFKIPLSTLGVTADQIKNQGIGVMYLDKYGTSPVGGTPYDPAFFDNVKDSYSQDSSSSKEKEDEDVITYAPARIGKAVVTGVNNIELDASADGAPVYFNLQGVRVEKPEAGIYIVRRGNKVSKEVVK